MGDSGRGSSAFAGAVDVVLRLKRPEGAARPGIRVLDALSRFDQTPDTLVIELTAAGYVALGDSESVATDEARMDVLKAAPGSAAEALREDDLLTAANVTRTVGQGVIREHVGNGQMLRLGAEERRSVPLLATGRRRNAFCRPQGSGCGRKHFRVGSARRNAFCRNSDPRPGRKK